MKKLIFLLILTGIFVFCGCGSYVNDSVSEITSNTFIAYDTIFEINYKTGKREKDYNPDGKAGKLVPFGVLTVEKVGTKLTEHKASFKLKVNDTEYEGDFEVNPFNNTFVFDTEKICAFNSSVSVIIYYDGKERDYKLKNVFTDNELKAEEALKLGTKALKPQIKKLVRSQKLRGEVHVRIVFSPSDLKLKPMWIVSVIDEKGNTYAVVLHAVTRKVLAKKL